MKLLSGKQLVLKPQDLLVVLKLAIIDKSDSTYAALAEELYMSVSEVHAAVKRAEIARLLNCTDEGIHVVRTSLLEFILHGVKYSFPSVTGPLVRGMPTAAAGPALSKYFESVKEEIFQVWPDPEGETRGISFQPLYSSVPKAAKRDPQLYEMLTLIDALRGGAARERELAKDELLERLA